MLSIEQSVNERLPWLKQFPRVRGPLAALLARLADEEGFNRVLEQAGGVEGFAFIDRTLEILGTSFQVNPGDLENIPADGPLLVVANHPLGMQDALALLKLIGSVRRDVRMLGNDWLVVVPPLRDLLLPIDVFGKGAASRLRGIYRALDNGAALIVFPAGEVSRMRLGGVLDREWSDGFARLAMRSKAAVLPVHVSARNSTAFYVLSVLAKPLSTAMLPREAVAPGVRRIGFTIGASISADELVQRSEGSSSQAATLMRRHVYGVGRHRELVFAGQPPLALPEPVEQVAAQLTQSQKLADLSDGKQAWLFTGALDSAVMREIGRLRELTFRKVGEGTGSRRDLDDYDAGYEHLVLWDPAAQRIVGAYRFGNGARIIADRGVSGLYSASLFNYSPALQSRALQGMELGRSFVAPAYWRSRALEQLWQGIGLYLQRHPELRYLFGPVSMSVNLPLEARQWIAATHQHYFGMSGLAQAREPFVVSPEVGESVRCSLDGLDVSAGLVKLKQHLDALGVSMPMLYRQYVELVEPAGVHFLGFGQDPKFSGCVDGLVMLDLAHLKPAKRARYLGKRSTSLAQ